MLIKQPFDFTPKHVDRTLHILLPDDWEQGAEPCPVMYFFDGHNLFRDADATYGKSWGLEDFLHGWDKRMIVVGMECGHDGNERLNEYSPYPLGGRWNVPGGDGESTMQWLAGEVKPWVDAHFPTMPFRECTGIGGSSMGGLMSLYAAIRWNAVFSKAACVSSAISGNMREFRQELARSPVSPDTRVWLSWGTEETSGSWGAGAVRANREMAEALGARGAAVQLFEQEGGRHCEADWEKQVPAFMRFLWRM